MTETKIKVEDLPTVYDAKSTEEKMYKFWEDGEYFKADAHSKKPPFTIVIPPPNVTGVLHMGHALDGTLQDILTRYHRMSGYEALWVPGTDHAGIATQAVVEKQLRKDVLARNRERWAQREARKQEEYNRQQIVKNSTEGVRKQVDATNKLLYEKRKLYNKK